jgi:hypothetical protein
MPRYLVWRVPFSGESIHLYHPPPPEKHQPLCLITSPALWLCLQAPVLVPIPMPTAVQVPTVVPSPVPLEIPMTKLVPVSPCLLRLKLLL